MKVNHVIIENFYVASMSFNAIREYYILAKISEFTVRNLYTGFTICIFLAVGVEYTKI